MKVGVGQGSLARGTEGGHMAKKVEHWPGRPALGGRWGQCNKEVGPGALKVATWLRRCGTLGLEGRHWVEGRCRAKKFGKGH
jgi:hypothetical protein